MLRILDSSLHLLAVFDKVLICKTREVLNDAYLLNFTVTVDKSKSQYLYDSNNIILVGDDYFKVYKLKEVHKTGQTVTIDIQAEHLSYKLLESTVNNFNMTDTIMNIGATIVCPSGFNYESDFTETVNVKVDGTATRKALLLALANQCTGELDYWKNNIRLMRSIGENTIYAKFGNNINEITREQDFYNKTINYTINLIDTTNPNLKDLKRANLGDTVIVTDEELGIASVEKKVIEIERDYILGIHTKVTLGDPLPKIIEAIKKNIEVGNVITEVIHEQVINVETAHILNAWIKNLFVEYVETNMNARLDRTTTDRYFIRIKEEREEMVWQELNPNEYEEFKIPDPSDPSSNNMINVYFTAIGDHPDAYRYFTITHPASIHQDITQGEVNAFKVMVKKVKSEMVKYSKQFGSLKLSDGTETMAPIELFGAGTDTTGQTMRGKGFTFKDQRGLVFGTYNENNSDMTALLADGVDCCLKYWDMTKQQWMPLVSNWAGGAGNVIFHKDKTSFTEQDCVDLSAGTNALHIGYSSVGGVDTGKGTVMCREGLVFLGAECSEGLPPIVPTATYLYNNGVENIGLTGGFTIEDRAPQPAAGIGKKYDKYVSLTAKSDQSIQLESVRKVDVTRYSKIYFDLTCSVTPHQWNWIRCGLSPMRRTTLANYYGCINSEVYQITLVNDRKIYSIDLNGISGEWYIAALSNGYTSTPVVTLVHSIWLE